MRSSARVLLVVHMLEQGDTSGWTATATETTGLQWALEFSSQTDTRPASWSIGGIWCGVTGLNLATVRMMTKLDRKLFCYRSLLYSTKTQTNDTVPAADQFDTICYLHSYFRINRLHSLYV